MTTAAHRPDESIDDLARRTGRLTPQRSAVLRAVVDSHDHLTVHQVQERCTAAGIRMQLSTVYRILDSCERVGLVHLVPSPGGMTYGTTDAGHIHAVCLTCSRVIDVAEDGGDAATPRTPFTTTRSSLTVTGECPQCRQHS